MTLFANNGQINLTAASFASVVKPAVASLLSLGFSRGNLNGREGFKTYNMVTLYEL
jgi:hypothetical protein